MGEYDVTENGMKPAEGNPEKEPYRYQDLALQTTPSTEVKWHAVELPVSLSSALVTVHPVPWRRGIELYIETVEGFSLTHDGSWKKLPPYNVQQAPITLSYENAQQLADQLYAAGIRPTEAAGSAGALSATKAHLADLQKLVFKN